MDYACLDEVGLKNEKYIYLDFAWIFKGVIGAEIVILLGLTLAVLVARPFIMHYRLHERVAGLVTAFLRLDDMAY